MFTENEAWLWKIIRGSYCKFWLNKDDIEYHTELEVDIMWPWGSILKAYEREKGKQPKMKV